MTRNVLPFAARISAAQTIGFAGWSDVARVAKFRKPPIHPCHPEMACLYFPATDSQKSTSREIAVAKAALCIGINNDPGTHMDLQGCINDAQDWAAELTSREFAATQLIDAKTTKVAMSDAFRAEN